MRRSGSGPEKTAAIFGIRGQVGKSYRPASRIAGRHAKVITCRIMRECHHFTDRNAKAANPSIDSV